MSQNQSNEADGNPSTPPTKISVPFGDVMDRGVITHLSHQDVVVEITEPYSGFSATSHIPLLLAGHVSFLRRDHGKQQAEKLLQELYENLQVVNGNLPNVLLEFAQLKRTVAEREVRGLSEDALAEWKRESRRAIRKGQRTPVEHQQLLERQEKIRRTTKFAVWMMKERFSEAIVGRTVGIGFTKQLLRYLEGLTKQ
jgi:hypothetical protein